MGNSTTFQGTIMHKFKFYIFLLLGFFCVLLVGCLKNNKDVVIDNTIVKNMKSRNVKDSAPKGPPITKFKEVKPVDGPLSRYGNPASYEVDGKNYNVMLSAKGYQERGIASWYGTKFHKQNTSSGDKYDMYALTAAHKTLPLPTYIKVTNVENGKVAILKVNDRGPFHDGRILDLSYGAANKLGIFPRGTAMVQINAISKQQNVAKYYLQAGAFDSNQSAIRLQKKIAQYTSKVVFITKINNKFLVRIGPFFDKQSSDNFKKILASEGLPGVFSILI